METLIKEAIEKINENKERITNSQLNIFSIANEFVLPSVIAKLSQSETKEIEIIEGRLNDGESRDITKIYLDADTLWYESTDNTVLQQGDDWADQITVLRTADYIEVIDFLANWLAENP